MQPPEREGGRDEMSDFGLAKFLLDFEEKVMAELVLLRKGVVQLRQEVIAGRDDPQEIAGISATLRSKTDELADQVTAFPGQQPPSAPPSS